MTPIDEIKNRLDIVDVVQGYIRLKKAGKDYKALCPFHKEKNPSFFVSPSKQIWHCFSCNFGGDMFTFVQKIEGVEFGDALRTLAKKAGVVLKREDPQIRSKRNILYEISEEAAKFFEKKFQPSAGQPQAEKETKAVREYLKDRGVCSRSIKDFRIGFAVDSWSALHDYLTELGYKPKDIESAGLIIQNSKFNQNSKFKIQDSRYYDRFRNRIMFPIFDLNGQVIGFSGRIFGKEEGTGKYVNTPETLIYNKSRVIYGLDKAKLEIRKTNQCILVEGQFDVIMAHQAGNENTIAVSGTALTWEHLRILKRYTENLVFCFDADIGGEAATKKAIGLAQQLEFNIKIVLLPKDKDPADIIKQSSKKWKNLLKKAEPIMEFYFENTFAKYNKTLNVDNKREIAKELLLPIKNITNNVEQAHWIQVLAAKLRVEEKGLVEALRRVKAREQGQEVFSAPETVQKSRTENLEEYLLGLVLKYPKHQEYLKKSFKEIFLKISKLKTDVKNYLIFKIEHCNLEEKDVLEEIDCCIRELKTNKIKQEMKEISLDIKEVEQKKDKKGSAKLTKKFSKLANELAKINQ
jgi:DNA primase